MTDQIALQETNLSNNEIADVLGASSSGGTATKIPTLAINYDPDFKMGGIYLKYASGSPDNIHATSDVRFRAFSSHVQWQHWGESGLINKSTLVKYKNNRGKQTEARDQLGGVCCGLPDYDTFWSLTQPERDALSGRDCYRIVRGLVSFTGKSADGTEHVVENQPVIFKGKGRNYGAFTPEVSNKVPDGKNLWDFESILSIEQKVNVHKKKYWIMHFDYQLNNQLVMDQLIEETRDHILELVVGENRRVEEMYKAATMQAIDEAEQDRIMDEVNTLEADYQVA